MAEDSPCRLTPSTMPSSVHSMGRVYRILMEDAAVLSFVIPGRELGERTMVRRCAPENLEIPGLVLTHHPGMTKEFTR
jgi:hypothetical protein